MTSKNIIRFVGPSDMVQSAMNKLAKLNSSKPCCFVTQNALDPDSSILSIQKMYYGAMESRVIHEHGLSHCN